MIAGEPDPGCPDVRAMIDGVTVRFGDARLDDLVQVTDSRLSATDLAAWHAWRQNWMLRVLHRLQLDAGVAAGVLAVVAAVSGPAGDPVSRSVASELAWPAAVVLCGAALFIELSLSADHRRFPTFPTRVRLARRIRTRVNLQPLRDSAVEELIGGPRADPARLVVVARACAASITGGADWRSDRLDALRVRCDVDGMLARIARDAAAFERARVRDGAGRTATADWGSLVDRVGWLQRYERQLLRLTAQPGGRPATGRGPAARTDRIVADLQFTVFVLTITGWTSRTNSTRRITGGPGRRGE